MDTSRGAQELQDPGYEPDLVWNLYLQSSTGTTSVSRMYLAPGSDTTESVSSAFDIRDRRKISLRK